MRVYFFWTHPDVWRDLEKARGPARIGRRGTELGSRGVFLPGGLAGKPRGASRSRAGRSSAPAHLRLPPGMAHRVGAGSPCASRGPPADGGPGVPRPPRQGGLVPPPLRSAHPAPAGSCFRAPRAAPPSPRRPPFPRGRRLVFSTSRGPGWRRARRGSWTGGSPVRRWGAGPSFDGRAGARGTHRGPGG